MEPVSIIKQWLSNDNTKKIQHILLFFIFLFALSHKMFDNLFGCSLNKISKNIYLRHAISILFLFLIVDINIETKHNFINPIYSFIFSLFLYFIAILLLHSNQIYIFFIIILIFLIIIINKYKKYLSYSLQDEELRQEQLEMIYKSNNVFVILMFLTIFIGSITSFKFSSFSNILHMKEEKNC
jgi:hypothetical protein